MMSMLLLVGNILYHLGKGLLSNSMSPKDPVLFLFLLHYAADQERVLLTIQDERVDSLRNLLGHSTIPGNVLIMVEENQTNLSEVVLVLQDLSYHSCDSCFRALDEVVPALHILKDTSESSFD